MKIIYIIPSLQIGGAQKIALQLCNDFVSKEDHEVILCVCGCGIDSIYLEQLDKKIKLIEFKKKPKPLSINNFPIRMIWEVYAFWKMCYVLRREKPDIVNTHLGEIFYFNIFSIFLPYKFFHTVHNTANMEANHKNKFLRNLFLVFRKFFFSSKKVIPIAVSEAVAISIKEYYKISCPVINNGVVELRKSKYYDEVKKNIQKLKKDNSTQIFINIGRIHPQKNQKVLVNIFKNLEYKNIILIILGSVVDKSKYLLDDINAIQADNVFFIEAKPNVGDYLSCSDFFCLPSLWEGLPLALLEAMSINIPVICTPIGGAVNVIQNGVNGFLSKSTDDKDILEVIQTALRTDKNNLQEMTLRAKKDFLEKYEISHCGNQYINLYQKYLD